MTGRARLSRAVAVGVAILATALVQWGCGTAGRLQADSPKKNAPTKVLPAEASLFGVSPEQLAHLHIAPVTSGSWQTSVETTGTVDWDEDRTTQAITQVSGPITRIVADYGSQVRAGQPLLYVASPDVANAIATYEKARDQQNLAQTTLAREKELLAHGAAAQKDVEIAASAYNVATTDVQDSLQSLHIFSITPEELQKAEQKGVPVNAELALRAPISGTVVQKMVTPGQVIQAGATTCFVLTDTTRVWVQGHIFDRDLPLVQVGDEVDLTESALPEVFHGKVSYIGAIVDPTTRTTPVRIVTRNRNDLLKQGMYLDAVIHTNTQRSVLSVPVSAVLHNAENEPFVYVEVKPREFARRPVTVGMQQNGRIEIRGGLKQGEPVVTEGSVFLQFASSYQ